jgi:signal transduction histidine kinase
MTAAQTPSTNQKLGSEKSEEAPELSVRVVAMILHHFRSTLGQERLQQFWQREGIHLPISHFEDHSNYVSLRFTERLTELLAKESGDRDFIRKAAMRASTPEVLGFMFHMVRAFATPQQSYVNVIRLAPTYNRVGSFTIRELSSDRMVLEYRSQVPEQNRNFCIGRMSQFASLPTIWNLPPADVREEGCQVEGAECCHYILHWQNPIRAWRKYAGAVAGFTIGILATLAGVSEAVFAIPALTVTGAFAGALVDGSRELRRMQEQLSGQNEGLARSLEELQRRSDEIFRANVELENRVTERTQELSSAKTRLEDALARAREVDRLKTQFFDNVSHELRTPLTLILLTLESLQQAADQLPAGTRQHLDRMEKSSSRLLKLINDLLDLAKLEAGKMRLRYDPVDLKQLLMGVLIPFRVLADGKGLSMRLDVPEAVETVYADPEKLDLVFQNLISNALKFTQSGEVVATITQDEKYVHASVRDTGLGIDHSDLATIFDRFSQADSSGTRRFGGTGIGLALVKETVELHGGIISVTSEFGRGSTFRVSIPRGTAHIREEIRERRRNDVPVRHERRLEHLAIFGRRDFRTGKPSDGAPSQQPGGTMAVDPTEEIRPRVLVVEDDPEIRNFLRGFLRHSYELFEAHDGEQGLKLALEKRPALIVSDVMMPVMSGLQMLEKLRSLPETVDIPVILLTARSDVAARVQGIGAGASDYIGKPFAPKELVARMEAQLRLRDAAARLAQSERLAAISLLTSGFAHEVRNPLNGLLNALAPLRDCLTSSPDPELALAMVSVAEESAVRIRHLAESLLAMVRTAATPVPLSLKDSLDAAARALQWKVPPEVAIDMAVGTEEDEVFGDPAALTQVWVNLIDNALRAVSPGGHIQVRVSREGKDVVASIQDNGCGIASEDMDRVFEPFFSTRPAGEGTGLGLALSRRIVIAHGGRMGIESEPGKGTTVTVRLPMHEPARVAEAELAAHRNVA